MYPYGASSNILPRLMKMTTLMAIVKSKANIWRYLSFDPKGFFILLFF